MEEISMDAAVQGYPHASAFTRLRVDTGCSHRSRT
jgi:hypothetical protein